VLQHVTIEAIKRQPLDFVRVTLASLHSLYTRFEPISYRRHWEDRQLWEVTDPRMFQVFGPSQVSEATLSRIEALHGLYQPISLGLLLPVTALLGLGVAWRLRPVAPAVVCGSLAIVLLLVHVALDGPVPRYRYMIEPLLNVLALGGVWSCARLVAHWTSRPVSTVAPLLAFSKSRQPAEPRLSRCDHDRDQMPVRLPGS
jgi:hypothetical protein